MSKNFSLRLLTSLFLLASLILMIKYSVAFLSFMIIIFVLSWIEFSHMIDKIVKKNSSKIIKFCLMLITFCYLSFFFGITVSNYINVYPSPNFNLLFIILICISSDIGGYLFGKTFKGKKLTKISPNKTYSGTYGSFILSVLLSIIFNNMFDLTETSLIIILTILISSICQLGDLFVSYLKRKAKLKDTGNILPGHGGILDRIDGILFALPFGFIITDYLII